MRNINFIIEIVLKAVENVGVKHVRGSNDWTEHLAKEFQTFKENGVLKALTDTKVPVSVECKLLKNTLLVGFWSVHPLSRS